MNLLTQDIAGVGGIALVGQPAGAGVVHMTAPGSIARTNTTDENLFVFPPGSTPVGIQVFSPAGSDAGTTAVIDVGIAGTDTQYVNAVNVKGAAGVGLFTPAGQTNLFASVGNAPVQVVGKYAETGTTSTTGGPWQAVGLYLL